MTAANQGSYAQSKVRSTTETKAGPKTTEFMLAVAFIILVIVAAYLDADDNFGREEGWQYAAIVAAGYVVSRGLAKLGVREPYSTDADAQR